MAHANGLFYSFLTYGRMHACSGCCMRIAFHWIFFILTFLFGRMVHAEIVLRLHMEFFPLILLRVIRVHTYIKS
jgi:hypothetical protein